MVKKKAKSKIPPLIYVALILFLIDFFTKYFIATNIPLMGYDDLWYPYGGIPVFSNFLGIEFSINHTINKGAAWSIFSEYQEILLFFRILLVFALLMYAIYFNKNPKYSLPLTLIIAGAVGNIVDYFVYGHVVDMFHFVFWGYDYPVFNVADSLIFIGILWLLLFTTSPTKSKGS